MIYLYCRNLLPDIFSLYDICWTLSRRYVLHFKQELHTIPENLNLPPILQTVYTEDLWNGVQMTIIDITITKDVLGMISRWSEFTLDF